MVSTIDTNAPWCRLSTPSGRPTFCRHGLEQSHNGLGRYWKKNAERAGR